MERERIMDFSTKGLVLITAIATTYTSCKYNDIKAQLEVQTGQLQAQETLLRINRDSVSFIREHKLKIYDKVYEALENPQKSKIDLATLLTREMLVNDVFQKNMLEVLGRFTDDNQVNKDVKEISNYEKEQDVVKATTDRFIEAISIDPKSYLVDIFFLESSSKFTMEKTYIIGKALKRIGYSVRVRKLSNIINARSAYQIYSNQIRYETGNTNEMAIAASLQQTINSAFQSNIELRSVSQSSPGYLSIFITK